MFLKFKQTLSLTCISTKYLLTKYHFYSFENSPVNKNSSNLFQWKKTSQTSFHVKKVHNCRFLLLKKFYKKKLCYIRNLMCQWQNGSTLFENSSTMQPATWSEMQYELLSTYLKKVFSLLSLSKLSRNPTIFNIIRWVAGSFVSSTNHLMVQVLFW